jgi:putative proteasome-type protease
MTYCLGILLDEGLLLMADTRTNAGVDNISSYQKLHCLERTPDREIYAACCGSLSATQAVLSLVAEGVGRKGEGPGRSLPEAVSMFRCAQIVGEAVRSANRALGEALEPEKARGTTCLLLGGRIGSEPPRLFQIYAEGNFIECKADVPFLQIGETKYGRPILDRVINRTTPLAAAVKIGFLSFDSAMRSNLSVARPIDLMVMPADARAPTLSKRIENDDAYFNDLSSRWSSLLFDATQAIPDPAFMSQVEVPRPLAVVSDIRA